MAQESLFLLSVCLFVFSFNYPIFQMLQKISTPSNTHGMLFRFSEGLRPLTPSKGLLSVIPLTPQEGLEGRLPELKNTALKFPLN